ncbi:MAG: ComF family protein [Myxococcota bacterium]
MNISIFFNLLFPKLCPACGKTIHSNDIFCPECFLQLDYLSPPLCKICGTPLSNEGICGYCSGNRQYWQRGYSLFKYQGAIATAIRKGKYGHSAWILRKLGILLSPFALLFKPDCLLPIPPTRTSWLKKGFSPSLELVKTIYKNWNGEFSKPRIEKNLLLRSGNLPPQVSLSPSQRKKLTPNSYLLAKSINSISAKRILLVDDVFTTGATLKAAAKFLKQQGYSGEIFFLTLARSVW